MNEIHFQYSAFVSYHDHMMQIKPFLRANFWKVQSFIRPFPKVLANSKFHFHLSINSCQMRIEFLDFVTNSCARYFLLNFWYKDLYQIHSIDFPDYFLSTSKFLVRDPELNLRSKFEVVKEWYLFTDSEHCAISILLTLNWVDLTRQKFHFLKDQPNLR